MFLKNDPVWTENCRKAVAAILDDPGEFGLKQKTFGLVALREEENQPVGYAMNGDWSCYPCSVVKAFHLVHALHRLADHTFSAPDDIDRALFDMIRWSSNTATNYVIDFLTDTTGDTPLDAEDFKVWQSKREGLNRYFATLNWPEWKDCNIAMKLSGDTRYGREAQLAGENSTNLNRLTPLAGARLFLDLFSDRLGLSPTGHARAKDILLRDRSSADSLNPNFQVADFLAGGLPAKATLWSKAGYTGWTGDPRTSYFRHDLIRIAMPDAKPVILSMMTQGRLMAEYGGEIFPRIGRILASHLLEPTAPGNGIRTQL